MVHILERQEYVGNTVNFRSCRRSFKLKQRVDRPQRIVVHSPETVDGKRHQQVDIYYNAIGLWRAPGPDEMEELFQAYWAKKQRKTA